MIDLRMLKTLKNICWKAVNHPVMLPLKAAAKNFAITAAMPMAAYIEDVREGYKDAVDDEKKVPVLNALLHINDDNFGSGMRTICGAVILGIGSLAAGIVALTEGGATVLQGTSILIGGTAVGVLAGPALTAGICSVIMATVVAPFTAIAAGCKDIKRLWKEGLKAKEHYKALEDAKAQKISEEAGVALPQVANILDTLSEEAREQVLTKLKEKFKGDFSKINIKEMERAGKMGMPITSKIDDARDITTSRRRGIS